MSIEETKNGTFRVPYPDEKTGKRKYKTFKSKVDAENFEADQEVNKKGKDFSVTMDERFMMIQLRHEAQKKGKSLTSFTNDFIRIIQAETSNSVTVQKAYEDFIDSCHKSNLRPDSIEQHDTYVGEFVKEDPERLVSSITDSEVLQHVLIRFTNDTSRNFVKASLLSWLRWCENEKKWCSGWIKTQIKWKRAKKDEKRIKIPTPEEAQTIIYNSPSQIQIGLMLMFYAGIRPSEIIHAKKPRLLQWEDIDFKERTIEILGEVAKTREYRIISGLPRVVWDWLETVPQEERKGRIVKNNHRNFRIARKTAFEAAGYDEVPQDFARHGFGSHAFHAIGVEMTIENMGHSNMKTFFRNYKGATNEERSERYFMGYPMGAKSPWPLSKTQLKLLPQYAVCRLH